VSSTDSTTDNKIIIRHPGPAEGPNLNTAYPHNSALARGNPFAVGGIVLLTATS
jgi:hypothetical protein